MAKRMKNWSELAKQQREADSDDKVRSKLGYCAAKILMKILCGARFLRMYLLRIIGFLACQFMRWTSTCDRRLFRLVCCCETTVKAVQVAWVGHPLSELQPCLFADADFAGCTLTQRSTTGVYMTVPGKWSCWLTLGLSKRQTCVSTWTPEADMVAEPLLRDRAKTIFADRRAARA